MGDGNYSEDNFVIEEKRDNRKVLEETFANMKLSKTKQIRNHVTTGSATITPCNIVITENKNIKVIDLQIRYYLTQTFQLL